MTNFDILDNQFLSLSENELSDIDGRSRSLGYLWSSSILEGYCRWNSTYRFWFGSWLFFRRKLI